MHEEDRQHADRVMRAEVSGIRVTELPSPLDRLWLLTAAGRRAGGYSSYLNSAQPWQPVSLGWSSHNPDPRNNVKLTSLRAG